MTAPATAATQPLSARAVLLIELALAMGGFAIGTGEFAIMGLMPNVAEGLGISEPQVGNVISTYALGVVVGAPLLAILGSRLYRLHLLLLLMGFFALGNFASALAPDYPTLMIARFVTGLPHGAYFGVAMLVAASMVPPDKRAQAVARVLMGLTVAILIGNPLATWLGQWLSWRYAFALVGAIALLTVLLVALFLPLNRDEPRNSPLHEIRAFNRPQVWLALAISSIGFAGMFCVFSYMAPTLLEVTGVNAGWIPSPWPPSASAASSATCSAAGCSIACVSRRSPGSCCGAPWCCWCFRWRHTRCGRSFRRYSPWAPWSPVTGPADPSDGRRGGCSDPGGSLQPCRLQHRQRLGTLARRSGNHRRTRLDLHRLYRRRDGRRRPAGVRLGLEGATQRAGGRRPQRRLLFLMPNLAWRAASRLARNMQ